jgi:hypothetical protein
MNEGPSESLCLIPESFMSGPLGPQAEEWSTSCLTARNLVQNEVLQNEVLQNEVLQNEVPDDSLSQRNGS